MAVLFQSDPPGEFRFRMDQDVDLGYHGWGMGLTMDLHDQTVTYLGFWCSVCVHLSYPMQGQDWCGGVIHYSDWLLIRVSGTIRIVRHPF